MSPAPVSRRYTLQHVMQARGARRPAGTQFIGGADDLQKLLADGELKA